MNSVTGSEALGTKEGSPPTANSSAGDAQRWVKASDAVQSTAKWIITALAAVGAVMFAKGFITTPRLSFSDDRWQLLLAWLLGVMGVLGIGVLISATARILFPTVITLGSLPPAFQTEVNNNANDFLPSGSSNLDAFEQGLHEYRIAVLDAPRHLRKAKLALRDAETRGEARAILTAKANFEELEAQYAALVAKRDLYLAKRKELLDRAQFWVASHGFRSRSNRMFLGAALAAIGGIGFQLALSAPEADEGGGEGGGAGSDALPFPRAGVLVQLANEAGASLWQAADLESCELNNEDEPSVPVIILAGTGTQEDPYRVSTVGAEAGCPPRTFPVIMDAATIVEAPQTVIRYAPKDKDGSDESPATE